LVDLNQQILHAPVVKNPGAPAPFDRKHPVIQKWPATAEVYGLVAILKRVRQGVVIEPGLCAIDFAKIVSGKTDKQHLHSVALMDEDTRTDNLAITQDTQQGPG